MCPYLFKHACYLSLHLSHSVPCLCVLKFSTPLVSRPAPSAVPARYAFIVQLCWSYSLLYTVKIVTNISEALEQCAKYAAFTRGENLNSKYKGYTFPTPSP
jgi:hypothetical protein